MSLASIIGGFVRVPKAGLSAAQVQALIDAAVGNIPAVSSGVYTPNTSGLDNLDGVTVSECQYLRVGDVVTVSGKFRVDPTGTLSNTSFLFDLPFPPPGNFVDDAQLGGVASFGVIAGGQVASISADTIGGSLAKMQWQSIDTANQFMFFTLTYRVVLGPYLQ